MLGDIWVDESDGHIWAWAEDDDDPGAFLWRDVQARERHSQLRSRGGGVHRYVRDHEHVLTVSSETLDRGPDDAVEQAERTSRRGLKRTLAANQTIRVGRIECKVVADPVEGLLQFVSTAKTRLIPPQLRHEP